MSESGDVDARIGDILERTAAFYASFLWGSEIGEGVRSRLTRRGIDEATLRAFQVGYAPGAWSELLAHLEQWRFSAAELHAAGIALLSERGHAHAHFRSRIMFPVRDPGGRILGFSGLATNPGPSWPEWLNSPDRGRYRRTAAIFGIDRARPAIARAGRALVLRDCLETLRMHRDGHREAVAVIRSDITEDHLDQLAVALGVDAVDLDSSEVVDRGPGVSGALVARPSSGAYRAGPRARLGTAARETGALEPASRAGVVPDATLSTAGRTLPYLASALIGVAIPLAWLWIAGADTDAPGGPGTAFILVVGGVAASYVLLTILASFVSARARARSRGRRMRTPWERGATEWQPPAWTYHTLEEILIGAALVSAVTCVVLFVTVGGFTGS
jgi:DNA primase catalytic core, N-terminal domain